MRKLNLLLLEDNIDEANALSAILSENNYNITWVKTKDEALHKIQSYAFDVLILDIMINGKPDGVYFAKQLNELQINIPFLFLTSMQSKVVFEEAKYTQPFSYLLKPFNKLELLYALDLALEQFYSQENTISLNPKSAVVSPKFIFAKKSKSVVKIEVSAIYYAEVNDKYITLYTDTENYLIRLSLNHLIEALGATNFIQVHRNYMVSLDKIKEIYFNDNLIILDNLTKIPLSKKFKLNFKLQNKIFK